MKTQRTLIMLLAIATMPCLANAQINDPKFYTPIDGWPFAQGGHTGDRVARISGGIEYEGRSAITLSEPVTGNARFEIWFYTGNAPDFNADNDVIGGNVGVFGLALLDSRDSGPGIHEHYNGSRYMLGISTEQFGSPWLKWDTGTLDGSEGSCGEFTGKCGVPTIHPDAIPGIPASVLPRVKGIFPPLDEWWGLQVDLDWDAEKERYVTWDLSYKQDSHEGWIPLTVDEQFDDSSVDEDGYMWQFDEIFLTNRPIGARGFARTYFDDISITSLDDPEAAPFFQTSFEEEDGWKLGPLQGQPDTQIPPDLAENNTRTGWQFWGHPLADGLEECPLGSQPNGCDVGAIHELEDPATFNPARHLGLDVVAPLGMSGPGPGDIDGDGDVDFTDFSTLAGNFTGTLDPGTGAKTRDNGDFDDDGDVDFGDFSELAGNFTGTITAAASARTVADEGDVHLKIDLTNDGAMKLEATNADLAGYSIRSPDSQLVPDADGAAAPFMFYLLNAPQEVTAGSVGSTTMLSEALALDISFAGDADQATDVVFQYTRAGDVTPVDGIVHVIPEPTTLPLLALGILMAWRRR